MWQNIKGMLALPDDPDEKAAARQGLLAAGAALMGGQGNLGGILGDGLMAGSQGYQGALAQQQQTALRRAQMQQIGFENQKMQAAQDEPMKLQQILTGGAQGGDAGAAPARSPIQPRTPEQQYADMMGYAERLTQAGRLAQAKPYYEMAEKLRPKLKEQAVRTIDGQRVIANVFEDGRTERVDGFAPDAEKLHFANTGATTVGQDQFTGRVVSRTANTASPDAQLSAATARRGQDLIERRAIATNPANKPLPTAALKMQQNELDALSTASGINGTLAGIEQQIKDKKLSFGPWSNLANRGLNSTGLSTEESRNFASFQSTLEKLRNDSLRLNAGVQTDGDAQRAWNELFTNINDTDLVKQRLTEIKNINKRAVQLRRLNIDGIRANYGHEALDTSRYEITDPAPNTGAAAGAPAVGTVKDGYRFNGGNPAIKSNWEKV